MGVSIKYGDFAPGAKESFAPTSDDALYEDNLEDLRIGGFFPKYGNPCEPYSVLLDGNTELLPQTEQGATEINAVIGFLSSETSDQYGAFSQPLELVLTKEDSVAGQFSSEGFTLTFDQYNNIFPKTIHIEWYRLGSVIETETFTADTSVFFCKKSVQNYDKVVMTFDNMNMPYSRLRIRQIDYGYGTIITADELRSVNITQQLNPISAEIAINTCDFVIDSIRTLSYNFLTKQPLEVYYNNDLLCATFVKTSTREGETNFKIQSEDYISLLGDVNFMGGIYTNTSVKTIIQAIFGSANIPYTIVGDCLDGKTVSGHIPICTCREALMQVLFAVSGAGIENETYVSHLYVADTSYATDVRIFELSETISQHIPLERIQQGQKVVDEATVTGVEVTSHTFSVNANAKYTELYKAADSGIGDGIMVKFSVPCHSLTVNDSTYGEIESSGANYAIINVRDSQFILKGIQYEHTTTVKAKNNPLFLTTDIANVAKVDGATLVTQSNVDKVVNMCYDYYIGKSNVSMAILEGKYQSETTAPLYDDAFRYDVDTYDITTVYTDQQKTKVGDLITADTEYLGAVTGRIEKQSYTLVGNIIWKKSEVR